MTAPAALRHARVPSCLLDPASRPESDGLVSCDIVLSSGQIADVLPAGTLPAAGAEDMEGRIVWPCFTDIHTHLDKALIWDRAPNPDGTFMGAITATNADREANWTVEDVSARIEFSLGCAYAHGTRALRTHFDTLGAHGARIWPLFREIQARWAAKIALQATALTIPERYLAPDGETIARAVADTPGGHLGCVLMRDNTTPEALDALFGMAIRFGLDLDLHVDENGDPDGTALEAIADAARRHRFAGRILCGHCCSLAVQPEEAQARIISKLRDTGIGIVSLPLCNLYLQDRTAGRTPRWRGVTLLHELDAAGVPVMFASDNVRDPFYAYGDFDMMEVYRESCRIGQLDHGHALWPAAVTTRAADWMGASHRLARGCAADLVVFQARSENALLSRTQMDRRVMRQGVFIDAIPPAYEELRASLA